MYDMYISFLSFSIHPCTQTVPNDTEWLISLLVFEGLNLLRVEFSSNFRLQIKLVLTRAQSNCKKIF